MLVEQNKKMTTDAALNGRPDMEARRKLDASLYPEAYPKACSYPPHALTSQPEYQAINSQVVDAQILVDQLSDALKKLSSCQGRLKESAQPESLPKFNDDQQALLLAAAKALGPFVGRAYRMKSEAQEAIDNLREQLRQLELDYRAANPRPPEEHFSGTGTAEFMKGQP